MRKNLLTVMALTGSVLATPVGGALEDKVPTVNAETSQELYPDLSGDKVVAIDFYKSPEGLSIYVEFDTNYDTYGDTIYFYKSMRMEGNLIILTYPFAVMIDRNRNKQIDEDEIIFLEREIIKELKPEEPTEPFLVNPPNMYPGLRGNYLVSIEFVESQEDLIAVMHYSSNKNTLPAKINVKYAHKVILKEGVVYLKPPYKAFFDLDNDGVAKDSEVFYLREDPFSEKKNTKMPDY